MCCFCQISRLLLKKYRLLAHLKHYLPFIDWQILRNAVNKTYNRISDLRKEISTLKNGVASAEEATTKAKAELEGAESKLTLVDGEPVLGENPGRLKRLKARAEKTKEEEVSARETLEVKEALLARALDENEVSVTNLLFLSFFSHGISYSIASCCCIDWKHINIKYSPRFC